MFDNMSTTIQGNVGLGVAIGSFCKKGYIVSIPLNDAQEYDLIVDFGEGPKTVQIKTTRRLSGNKKGSYVVAIKKMRYNKTDTRMIAYNKMAVDYLYVLTASGVEYMIPSTEVGGVTDITLNEKYNAYIL